MSSRSATSGTRRSGEGAVQEEIGADASISAVTTFSSAATARARGEVGRPWPRKTADGASVRPRRAAERRWSGLPVSTGAARVACFFSSEKFFQRKENGREGGEISRVAANTEKAISLEFGADRLRRKDTAPQGGERGTKGHRGALDRRRRNGSSRRSSSSSSSPKPLFFFALSALATFFTPNAASPAYLSIAQTSHATRRHG